MPATVDALKIFLGIDPASTVDAQAMQPACDSANALAVRFRADVTTDVDGPLAEWPADIDQGAILQAARLYGRRGSSAGALAFADIGVITIGRLDPDVRMLWQLGEYQGPVVA